jgi:uncharacterized protein (TIGR02147 family)
MIGMKSSNYLKNVIDGKRNVTEAAARRIAVACGLSGLEAQYFVNLVSWNLAKTPQLKNAFWKDLVQCLPVEAIQELNQAELKILEKWYIPVILEMTSLPQFVWDKNWIQATLKEKVALADIEEAMELLTRTGLLATEQGSVKKTYKLMFTGGNIPSQAIQNYHREMTQQALDSLANVHPSEREFGATTVALDEAEFQKIKKLLQDIQKRIVRASLNVKDSKALYQLNLQFFPVAIPRGDQ